MMRFAVGNAGFPSPKPSPSHCPCTCMCCLSAAFPSGAVWRVAGGRDLYLRALFFTPPPAALPPRHIGAQGVTALCYGGMAGLDSIRQPLQAVGMCGPCRLQNLPQLSAPALVHACTCRPGRRLVTMLVCARPSHRCWTWTGMTTAAMAPCWCAWRGTPRARTTRQTAAAALMAPPCGAQL